jgi:hypothetical protein
MHVDADSYNGGIGGVVSYARVAAGLCSGFSRLRNIFRRNKYYITLSLSPSIQWPMLHATNSFGILSSGFESPQLWKFLCLVEEVQQKISTTLHCGSRRHSRQHGADGCSFCRPCCLPWNPSWTIHHSCCWSKLSWGAQVWG